MKLSKQQVGEIRGSSRPPLVLSKRYGVSQDMIWRIQSNRLWKGIEAIPEGEIADPNNPALHGEWKPIKGFEGIYDVSSDGRVRSWSKRIEAETGFRPSLCSLAKNQKGYFVAKLVHEQKRKTFGVHILVAEAFVGPKPADKIVRHWDGNKENNDFTNLRYGTHFENFLDAVRHGTRKSKRYSTLAKEKAPR